MEPEHHVPDLGSTCERQEGGGVGSDDTRLWTGGDHERLMVQRSTLRQPGEEGAWALTGIRWQGSRKGDSRREVLICRGRGNQKGQFCLRRVLARPARWYRNDGLKCVINRLGRGPACRGIGAVPQLE